MSHLLIAAAFALAGLAAFEQNTETFKARLSPVPLDASMRANITGKGSASAVLSGRSLSLTGTFEGLKSAATAARLHQSRVTGVRGAAVVDLVVSKATSGTLTGSVNLTPEQVEGLRKGQFYIQIHSENAPQGNLWGWLLR